MVSNRAPGIPWATSRNPRRRQQILLTDDHQSGSLDAAEPVEGIEMQIGLSLAIVGLRLARVRIASNAIVSCTACSLRRKGAHPAKVSLQKRRRLSDRRRTPPWVRVSATDPGARIAP